MNHKLRDAIGERAEEVRQNSDALTRSAGPDHLDDDARKRLTAQVDFRLAQEYEWLLSVLP